MAQQRGVSGLRFNKDQNIGSKVGSVGQVEMQSAGTVGGGSNPKFSDISVVSEPESDPDGDYVCLQSRTL
ncbi:unnamed protein product [Ranitomeya imitator]|uniref:Uncharacterized protein n=1 Tax=Ranitomeya imitator TaxID=111125 RepID=A0ABN9KX63_9NEOB|nr:unnamed protein product [Ranitomeya imitator]